MTIVFTITGGGGGGGGAWPFARVKTVDPATSETGTNFNTLSSAVAAAVNGDVIMVGAGVHVVDSLTITKDIEIIGAGKYKTILTTSASSYVLLVTGGGFISQLTVTNTSTGGSDSSGILITTNPATIDNVAANITSTATDISGFHNQVAGTRLIRCEAVTSGGTNDYGVKSSTDVILEGGRYNGGDTDAFVSAGNLTLIGTILVNSTTGGAGTIQGDFFNVDGALSGNGGLVNYFANSLFTFDSLLNSGGVSVSGDYVVNMYLLRFSVGAGTVSLARTAATAPTPLSPYALSLTSTGVTYGAGDFTMISYAVESQYIKPLILSGFKLRTRVRSDTTGTYSIALRSDNGTIVSFITEFALTATIWTDITIDVPAPSIGTFPTDNTAGLIIDFVSGAGSTHQTATLDAWQTADKLAGNGISNAASVVFDISEIMLNSNTFLFESNLLTVDELWIARYYSHTYPVGIAVGTASSEGMAETSGAGGGLIGGLVTNRPKFIAPMRIAPTLVFFDQAGNINKFTLRKTNSGTIDNIAVAGTFNISPVDFLGAAVLTATNQTGLLIHYTADSNMI